jgi:glycosyltransferase involved in cell wall biosynthesis
MMLPKSVVMIAYAFPPEGAAGVFRPLRFIRQLPAMGWRPCVIAAEQYGYERYDPALLNLVPEETEVIRVPGRDPWQAFQLWRAQQVTENLAKTSTDGGQQPAKKASWRASVRRVLSELVQMAEAYGYHPDRGMLWIRPAVKATVALCSRVKPEAIWATAGPVSSLVVAQRVSHRTGIPYVADFRDAWTITYNKFEARRPRWAVYRDRKRMYSLLKAARTVVFRYQTEAECYWRAYAGALEPSKIHIIPNGYEGEIDSFSAPKGEKCTILYTGTLESYRFDTLLQALRLLKETDAIRAKQLRLVFVGEVEQLERDAVRMQLSDIVEAHGPASYGETNKLQAGAHALLILGRPSTMKGHELFAGAKLFTYLKAGRPIIGVLPADETRKILRHVGVSTVADADSPREIVVLLQRIVNAWNHGTLTELVPDARACEAYSAPKQTAALVRALLGKPAADPFVPGCVEIPPSLIAEIDNRAWTANPSLACRV